MRVLMLGWDFSPRLSGGVGSACQGLANALARAAEPLATQVLFVLPRVRGDEEPENVELLGGDRPPPARALPAETTPSATADERANAPGTAPFVESAAESLPEPLPDPLAAPRASAPSLPSPAEALRLLAIDSPLRPYLSPEQYASDVRALFARLRVDTPAQPPPPALPARARTAARRAQPARLASARASAVLPAATAQAPEDVPVPPYGRTLVAEVERYARSALALVQGEHFDVIHAHDWMSFPAALLIEERTGKPLVVHFHSSEAERRGAQGSADVRAIEQAAIEAADRVLCVSEASVRTLRSHYAVETAKVRVVHNAFSPLAAAAPRAKSAGPVVLYLGRLSEQKAPDVFLRAAARVRAHSPEARFVLAGAGELYPELVELARELELEDKVEFTGFVAGEELARTYAGADVYVLSSAAEPFGITALEALSLGVPTIVPSGAGVSEVVRSVLRFAPLDELDLADKIVALLERPALRKQLSAAGLAEVKRLRWDRPARALRGIYDEIVSAT